MPEKELPPLTTAELVARFGDDDRALRRYRMLVALLREGRPPGEVARTFGVSRESIRRLRQAYRGQGLDAVRSRPRGGGHLNHSTALALIVRQELANEPDAAAATLWRRVQQRVAEEGTTVPRSTFYRLLARLREDAATAGSARASVALLRDALTDLAEDPPLTLGRSDLAGLLLPNLRDSLQRGWRLQRAIRAAIERLRPSEAGPVLDDTRWRHYLIIAGEYETGEKRSALQQALALSASTYSRAKREALQRLVAMLPHALGELPPAEPSTAIFAPPPPVNHFEDEAILDNYTTRLRRRGIALLWGPAGVGKIDLALTLAERLQARGQKIVWYACRPPDIERGQEPSLLAALAAALAHEGQTRLWETIGAANPDVQAQRFAELSAALVGRRWTVMLANAHWLAGAEDARVLDALTAAQAQMHIRLVLIGRDIPIWADAEHWPPLPLPGDDQARRQFLRRMSDQPAGLSLASELSIGALRDRVTELIAAIPVELLDTLPADQLGQILAALRPVEHLATELRSTMQPPDKAT